MARIYLDSRDLIALVSRDEPMRSVDFGEYLRATGWRLVYSFTNICEVTVLEDVLETRHRLQVLESLPHDYLLGFPRLCRVEFAAALRAFDAGLDSPRANPFVGRWHKTYWHPDKLDYQEMLVNYPLVDQVMPLVIHNPDVCRNKPCHAAYLRSAVEEDRTVTDPVRRSSLRFEGSVKRTLLECSLRPLTWEARDFARWLRDDPSWCPGWRLFNESYLRFCSNAQDAAKLGDTSDWSSVSSLPYVEAITLDRRMVEYARSASLALRAVNGSIDYAERIYPDTQHWLDAVTSNLRMQPSAPPA